MKGLLILVAVAVLATGCVEQQVNQDMAVASQAAEVAGQVNLTQAAAAASLYMAQGGSFDGFDAAAARAIEPNIQWVDGGPATAGAVSIRGAGGSSVVLVTLSGGSPQCLAFVNGAPHQGTADAQTAEEC